METNDSPRDIDHKSPGFIQSPPLIPSTSPPRPPTPRPAIASIGSPPWPLSPQREVSPSGYYREPYPDIAQGHHIIVDSLHNGQSASYVCNVEGCNAPPFQSQYLLNSHTNIHSSLRPHFCPVPGCPRAEGGKGFKRKNEMIRHGLVHDSPGYVCPFCPDREHRYPRPDNLQRHVRVHHVDKEKDDPLLRDVLSQRPDLHKRGRRRRGVASETATNNDKIALPVAPSQETASSKDRLEGSHESLPSPRPLAEMMLETGESPVAMLNKTVDPRLFLKTDGTRGLYFPIPSTWSGTKVPRHINSQFTTRSTAILASELSPNDDPFDHFASPREVPLLRAISGDPVVEVQSPLRESQHNTNYFACEYMQLFGHSNAKFYIDQKSGSSIGYLSEEGRMIYHVPGVDTTYRIEYPFSDIESIRMVDVPSTKDAMMMINLIKVPIIVENSCVVRNAQFHSLDGPKLFKPADFRYHAIGGDSNIIGPQFRELRAIESFVNRHKSFAPIKQEVALTTKEVETFTDSRYASNPVVRYSSNSGNQSGSATGLAEDTDDTESVLSVATTVRAIGPFVSRHRSFPPINQEFALTTKEVETFTDSGYASNPVVRYSSNSGNQNGSAAGLGEDTDDTETVLSAASTVDNPLIQNTVDWICNDIHNNIRHMVDPISHKHLSHRLPDFVKAFAIQLGTGTSDPLGLRIMHFIRDIISRLNARFDPYTDDQANHQKDVAPDMSFIEKMDLWRNMSTKCGSSFDPADSPGVEYNVEDCVKSDVSQDESQVDESRNVDDELDMLPVGLPGYNKAILDSSAYRWLLSALSKHFSAHWGESQRNVMVDEIQAKILQNLPTGTISKRRPPRSFKVTFRLHWGPFRARAHQERIAWRQGVGVFLLNEMITLTGSSGNEAQVTTVGRYFNQTWPNGGVDFIDSLQRLIEDQFISSPFTVNSKHTQCDFSISGEYLVVAVSGPAYFIAQCGEQLAWLSSAVQPPDQEPTVLVPCLKETRALDFSIEATSQPRDGAFQLPHLRTTPLTLFTNRVASCNVVYGYPIARRPEGFRGLEVSWIDLLSIAQRPTLDLVESKGIKRRLLQGTFVTLELTRIENQVALWYIAGSNTSLSTGPREKANDNRTVQNVTFEELALVRHIIDTSEEIEVLQHRNVMKEFHSVQRRQRCSVDPCQDAMSRPNNLTESCDSVATCSLLNDSIDSDMLSISSLSNDTQSNPSDNKEGYVPLVVDVCDRLLASFRPAADSASGLEDDEGTSNSASRSSKSGTRASTSKSTGNDLTGSRKRLCSQGNDENEGEDGLQRPVTKKQKKNDQDPQSIFACPFLKYNPVQHHDCFSFTLRTVSRVKQHLVRNHVPEFYCQRCFLKFQNIGDYNAHVMRPTESICIPSPIGRLDGVTPQQQRQLARKFKHPTCSEAEKWFIVWDIVFPEVPRPSSPYLDRRLTEDCTMFQEHSLNQGPDIMMRAIEESGVFSGTDLTEEARNEILRRAITNGFNHILFTWTQSPEGRENRSSGQPPLFGTSEDSNIAETTSGATSSGSALDSGIIMSQGSDHALSLSSGHPSRPPEAELEAFSGLVMNEIEQQASGSTYEPYEPTQGDQSSTLLQAPALDAHFVEPGLGSYIGVPDDRRPGLDLGPSRLEIFLRDTELLKKSWEDNDLCLSWEILDT